MKTKHLPIFIVILLISFSRTIGQTNYSNDELDGNASVSINSKLISETDLIMQYQQNLLGGKEYFKFKFDHCPALNQKYNNMGVYLAVNPGNVKNPMTDAAIDLFNKSISKHATPEAYWNNSIAYTSIKNYYRASANLEKYLNNELSIGLFKLAGYNKGTIEALNGDYYSTIADITSIIDTGSKRTECYINRGLAYTEVDSFPKAIRDFKRVCLRMNSKGYAGMGYVYSKQKDYKSALKFFRKASVLKHDNLYRLNKGNLLLANKKYKRPGRIFTTLIQDKKYKTEAYLGKGMAMYYNSNPSKALFCFNNVLHIDSVNVDAFIGKAFVNVDQKNYDVAIDNFYLALKYEPENIDAFKGLGIANYFNGNKTAALACFKVCKQIDSTYEYEYETYIIMAHLFPNNLTAVLLKKAINIEPDNPVAYVELGNYNFDNENYGEAINNYTQALKHNNDCKECLVNRGNANFRLDNFDNAIEDFTKAIKLDTTDINTYNGLGLAYKETDKFQESISTFNNAIHIAPNSSMLYNNLSLTYDQIGMSQNFIQNTDSANKAFDIAQRYLDIAFVNDLNEIIYINNSGLILKERMEYDKAIAEFDKMPYYACLNNRGVVKALKGNITGAIEDFDSAFTSMDSIRFEPIKNKSEVMKNNNMTFDNSLFGNTEHNFRKNKYQKDEYTVLYYYNTKNEEIPVGKYLLTKSYKISSPSFCNIEEKYLVFDTEKYRFDKAKDVKKDKTQKKHRRKMSFEKCVKG